MLAATLRADGAPGGTCTHILPADNGLLFYSATEAEMALKSAEFGVQSAEFRRIETIRVGSVECNAQNLAGMKHENLRLRTKQFALNVIKFCEGLPKDETGKTLGRQLLRSGCSVGANYRAACRAKSKADFISKMAIMLEEADQSAYWIELLQEAGKEAEIN